MRSIRFIPFDQLHQKYGALKDAHKTQDLIVLIESQSMLKGAQWHPERLFFLLSSARHFVQTLQEKGFNGVDRTDSTKGYVPDNVLPCCQMCNFMKGSVPPNTFIHHVEQILTHQDIIQGRKTLLCVDTYSACVMGGFVVKLNPVTPGRFLPGRGILRFEGSDIRKNKTFKSLNYSMSISD